ncbi:MULTISPECIES: hypothetical protein [Pectobacterium]|uniref:Uncharacterized protein n=1 Tax=Pectobacterium parvum TaxID=2778550 RepID=A0ABW8FX89_9GAMM|nr:MULTISPECIES: hypothetical protein [Pectobacterium]UVD99602.1 hypothetical protein NV347_19725 [Pectobacterium parvum]
MVDVLMELEWPRHLTLEMDVHPILFTQLKAVLHVFEIFIQLNPK